MYFKIVFPYKYVEVCCWFFVCLWLLFFIWGDLVSLYLSSSLLVSYQFPLCWSSSFSLFGFWFYSLIHLKILKLEILWHSGCFDANFREWLKNASPSPPLHKDLCMFPFGHQWAGVGSAVRDDVSQSSIATRKRDFWLDAAFPDLSTHSLPAFLLLAFWCHSVINKGREEPRNCFSPLPVRARQSW